MTDTKQPEEKYTGATYLTINSLNVEQKEEILSALAEFTMKLDKCRIATYATVNIGKPNCGPQGCP